MAQLWPLTLSGDNLGERHRDLNSQVLQAVTRPITFEDIRALPEHAPVDRLFKIDLAIKLHDVDFILQNLKDDDMLYVSRALKCKWLLERGDIINPKYLESVLFPEMVIPAIGKMKHWLYISVRDPLMCQEFYLYYKDTKFDYAVKFLSHCDNEFIVSEFPKILLKITPHYLKVLGERNPKLIKVYFDALSTDNELVKRYLKEEVIFYNSVKCVLKSDSSLFLDIIEKYYNLNQFNKFNAPITDYIMRFEKSRFLAKPELYVVYVLHIPTVARRLSVEECQEVVMKLARSDYLSWWFSYKNVEPLVKRFSLESRAAFKKRVFVNKDVGEMIPEWPYELPASPVDKDTSSDEPHVFHDQEYEPLQYVVRHFWKRRIMKKKCSGKYCEQIFSENNIVKSELQKLFNEFRFVGFNGTLHKLNERLGATSSADRRRDMLLVLVSKSGGHADNVRELLQLALRLRNEPAHERAAVVRSLVKRASAWRLPQELWDMMLEYARGLGLDGTEPEAECREGLHAVLIRQFIAMDSCNPGLTAAFLEDFSTLDEYKLMPSERVKVSMGLQNILVIAAANAEPGAAARLIGKLLDVYETYHIRIASSVVALTVAELAERDFEEAQPLLERLYEARVGRRELFRQYLKIRQDDAAILNALRHDPDAFTAEWLVQLLATGETSANQTFLKIAVYFNEKGGLAEQVLRALQSKIVEDPNVKLARPLAIVAGHDITSIWRDQDLAKGENFKLAAALRANMHRARPAVNALTLGWRKVGMKAVAWRAMRCRPSHVTQITKMLLEERVKRTVRLALTLAQRTECAVDIFTTAMTIRPLAALRAALLYYRNLGDAADLRIWDIVKIIIPRVDLAPCEGLRFILRKVDWVPTSMKPDYCATMYLAFDKISDTHAEYILCDLMKCLPEVTDNLLDNVLLQMLEKMDKEESVSYPALVIRYLILSKSDTELKMRFEKIGEPFLAKLDAIRAEKNSLKQSFISENYDQLKLSLQYNSAFFDTKYQYCLPVIERILTEIQMFMPKEIYFEQYVKIHSTMLYYKAVRQSIKQKPEVFEDPAKKMCEGVEIVGFTFGRYIVTELAELKSKYFDSIVELYCNALVNYLNEYFMYCSTVKMFIVAITKGILSGNVCSEGRIAISIMEQCQYSIENDEREEIKTLSLNSRDKVMQFFVHEILA